MKINLKKNLESGAELIKKGCVFVLPIIAMAIVQNTTKPTQKQSSFVCYGNAGYSDAIKAIGNSDMFSSDKQKVMSSIPQDANFQIYSSIIEVVNSDMFSSNKRDTVLKMVDKK